MARGLEYPYLFVCDAADTSRLTGVLSRVEPLSVNCHTDLEFKYFEDRRQVLRGLLELEFPGDDAGGRPWRLFVVHLKSRHSEHPQDPRSALYREREARAVRDWIRRQYPPVTQPRYLIVGDFNDHKSEPAVARFLKIGGRRYAYLVPAKDSRGERWTFFYRKKDLYERVDFLLASKALWPRVVGKAGHVVDLLPESLIGSDHRLLWLSLNP